MGATDILKQKSVNCHAITQKYTETNRNYS
jgi:hypothetical protein